MSDVTAADPPADLRQGRFACSGQQLVVYADTYGAHHLAAVSEFAGRIVLQDLSGLANHTAEDLVAVITRDLSTATATAAKLLAQTESCGQVGLVVSGLGLVDFNAVSAVCADLAIREIGGTQGSPVVWLTRRDDDSQAADTGSVLWALWLAESPYVKELPDNTSWPKTDQALDLCENPDSAVIADPTPTAGDTTILDRSESISATARRRKRRKRIWSAKTSGVGLATALVMIVLSHSWATGFAAFGAVVAVGMLGWAHKRTRVLLRRMDRRDRHLIDTFSQKINGLEAQLLEIERRINAVERSTANIAPTSKAQTDNIARMTATTGIAAAQVKELITRLDKDRSAHK